MKILANLILTTSMYWCNLLQHSLHFLRMRKTCHQYLMAFSMLSYDQQFDHSGNFAPNLLGVLGHIWLFLHTMELMQVWLKSSISLISIQDTDSCQELLPCDFDKKHLLEIFILNCFSICQYVLCLRLDETLLSPYIIMPNSRTIFLSALLKN